MSSPGYLINIKFNKGGITHGKGKRQGEEKIVVSKNIHKSRKSSSEEIEEKDSSEKEACCEKTRGYEGSS